MNIRLKVWLTQPDGCVAQAGELAARLRDNHSLEGQFRYAPSYLDDPAAIPLDPVNLPLQPGPQDAGRPHAGIHGVFEDALPDDWGRRLLCRQHDLSAHQTRPPWLLPLLRGGGMGALRFGKEQCPQIQPHPPPVSLEEVARAALDFEQGKSREEMPLLPYLYGVGTSPGGARPKFLLTGEEGRHYLVKLPSLRDRESLVPVEAACMAAAADCGFPVAPSQLRNQGLPMLLVERFDITPQGGRRHMVSLKTLLNAEHYYSKGYLDIAQILEKHSDDPGQDKSNLFRQMLFNAAIGNTDDHLKNFALLHDAHGWRLSPAYDLTPTLPLMPGMEHTLRFLWDHRRPDAATLEQLGRAMGFSAARVRRLRDEVAAGLASLPGQLESAGVAEETAAKLLAHAGGYLEFRAAW